MAIPPALLGSVLVFMDNNITFRAVNRPQNKVLKGSASRRRDCHSAAPPFTFSRRIYSDMERASSK